MLRVLQDGAPAQHYTARLAIHAEHGEIQETGRSLSTPLEETLRFDDVLPGTATLEVTLEGQIQTQTFTLGAGEAWEITLGFEKPPQAP